MLTVDQCLAKNALNVTFKLNVTLRAFFARAHIITQQQLGPYIRDEYRADRAFANYIMAMLNTRYDTPIC